MPNRRIGSEQESPQSEGLNEELGRFVKGSRSRHEAEERAKALDGREDDVRRRQERADKDNEPMPQHKKTGKKTH